MRHRLVICTTVVAIIIVAVSGCSQEKIDELKSSNGPSLRNRVPPAYYTQGRLDVPTNLDDRYYNQTGAWSNTYKDLWAHLEIGVSNLYNSIVLPAEEIVVAVLDTGVDVDHEDLAGRLWVNPREIPQDRYSNRVDDDQNGFSDDFIGWDWVNNSNNPSDDHGHGTHVAGTIAAIGGNAKGIVGVAPWVRIMALKVCDYQGACESNDIRDAILYANRNGAKVVNLSLGGPDDGPEGRAFSDTIEEVTKNGTLVVTSAGNDAMDVGEYSPANSTYAVAVAAHRSDGKVCSFSNFGWKLDVSAGGCGEKNGLDGGGIISANSKKCGSLGDQYCAVRTAIGERYSLKYGTSMSTPHIAGLAAVVWSINPDLTPQQVRQVLIKSSVPITQSSKHIDFGFGKANAADIPRLAAEAPGLKIYSPFHGTTASQHQIKFRLEAQSALTWELRYIELNGTEVDLSLTGSSLLASGNLSASTSVDLSETFQPVNNGSYLLLLKAEIGADTYYDTLLVRK